MNRESIKRDVAVIGISCKFSKSENPLEFWKNLKNGQTMIEFYTDEELLEYGVNRNLIRNPKYVKRKTYVEKSNSFDYPFFGYTKDEANLMDPQIRIMHEEVWKSLEDSGYNPFTYNEKIGLYTTASDNFTWIAHTMSSENKNVDPFFLSQINNKNFISSLISYNLNLRGPSIVLDTACSSSLTTIHLASRSLLLRECSLAVAGGVVLNSSAEKGYFYQEGMISSKDGSCRAFDIESTGTTGSEGAAVVVLKRLEEAIRDRDNIYAIIRSSAANNDGNRKVGYTAPSVVGQSDCIKMAHKIANVPYKTISYVEAHGTGTKLGDPIEIEALNKSFNYDNSFSCAIGSIKSNAGHLGNAAGIAGFIKTVLSLKNKMIPPSLDFKIPNPEINFKDGPFYVNTSLKNWENDIENPLRAGVSSFGIGGTNVHMILEEFQRTNEINESRPYQLIISSAKTLNSLRNNLSTIEDFIKNNTLTIADLSYTLMGRAKYIYRDFFVYSNEDKAKLNLAEKKENHLPIEKKDVVFMFSGQGSQYFKMAKDLYQEEPGFKTKMDSGFEILSKITNKDFSEILGYSENDKTDPKLINNTLYTQPILFLVEYSLCSLLLEWNIKPSYMIGHSLGEYTAACIAGVLSLEDTLKLIVCRSKLMDQVEEGSMLAINATVEEVGEFLNEKLSIASINSDTSCVVSGSKQEINNLANLLNTNEINSSTLKTSHAFHSHMMDVILYEFKEELSKISFSNPKISFISNLTGKPILDEEATSPDYWVNHLRHTVKFGDGIEFILKRTNALYIEIGPGKTLTNLCKQNKYFSEKNNVIDLIKSHSDTINDNLKFTNAIGEIWKHGVEIDWNKYYMYENRSKISAPNYCFENHTLDFTVELNKNVSINNSFKSKDINDWLYFPNWKKTFLKKNNFIKDMSFIVFSDDSELINKLNKHLDGDSNSLIIVKKGDKFNQLNDFTYEINPNNENDYVKLLSVLKNNNIIINQIIYNWSFEGENQKTMIYNFLAINYLCKSLIEGFLGEKIKITLLCNLNHSIFGNEKINVAMSSSLMQFYVFSQENPNIFFCTIDINQEEINENVISKVVDDLKFNYTDRSVAFRNRTRLASFFDKLSFETNSQNLIKENKTYLIIGGLGKVGKILTSHLVKKYNSKVIIIGRKEIQKDDKWNAFLDNLNSDDNNTNNTNYSVKVDKKNLVFYYNADVSIFNDLKTTIEKIENEHGKISGVIHAAGNVEPKSFKLIEHINQPIIISQFSPKIQGTLNIYNLLKEKKLDFVWITSSLSSIIGGLTFGSYSVANAFIDNFIQNKKEDLNNWFTANLDGISEEIIDEQDLVEIFEKSLVDNFNSQIIISKNNPNELVIKQFNKDEDEVLTDDSNLENNNSNFIPPNTEIETELCRIVETFFGYKKIGILDNFFELGVDSLKAMTLIKRINKFYEIGLNIQDFYSNPCIKELSKEIENATKITDSTGDISGENTIII